MSKPLDELYFVWLYSQVGSVDVSDPSQTYWRIIRQLYTKEFVWIVPHDDNRAADGRDLRHEFIEKKGLRNVDQNWLDLGCSMLELFIGVARRLSFEVDGESRIWFWHLMRNVGLNGHNDLAHWSEKKVDDILDRIIWRTYRPNGHGGMFPLQDAHEDQRHVDIWYQLNAYLLERVD